MLGIGDGKFLQTAILEREGKISQLAGTRLQLRRSGTESSLTLRWREVDSNYWSRHGETPLMRAIWFPRTARPARSGIDSERDEKFESVFLQRRVNELLVPLDNCRARFAGPAAACASARS